MVGKLNRYCLNDDLSFRWVAPFSQLRSSTKFSNHHFRSDKVVIRVDIVAGFAVEQSIY